MKKKYFDTVSTRVWAVKDVARGARARGDERGCALASLLVDALSERGVTIGRID